MRVYELRRLEDSILDFTMALPASMVSTVQRQLGLEELVAAATGANGEAGLGVISGRRSHIAWGL